MCVYSAHQEREVLIDNCHLSRVEYFVPSALAPIKLAFGWPALAEESVHSGADSMHSV